MFIIDIPRILPIIIIALTNYFYLYIYVYLIAVKNNKILSLFSILLINNFVHISVQNC